MLETANRRTLARAALFGAVLAVVGCASSSSDPPAAQTQGSGGASAGASAGGTNASGASSGKGGSGGTSGSGGKGGSSGTSSSGGKGGSSGKGSSGGGGSSSGGGSSGGGSGGSSSGGGSGGGGSGGSSGGSGSGGGSGGSGSGGGPPGWKLVWSDEFDGADGSPVDPAKWVHETGGDGWGNQEREYYTSTTDNSVQLGGKLVITARKADPAAKLTCWYGDCQFTSARLKTQGLYEKQYGRFAASIKIPGGQGVWPAFWMLGSDLGKVGWPTCGEIDIMENIGKEPSIVHGTIHVPGAKPGVGYGGPSMLGMGAFADGFHTYAAEWDATGVTFFVDDVKYYSVTPKDIGADPWKLDHPFFIVLNLSIGGGWPGDPNPQTPFPAEMIVDWVRVYDKG